MRIHAAGQCARQIIRQRADVFRDRHIVVVQHDQKVRGKRAGVIQCFECHARGQGAVADDGNDPAILAALRRRDGHTQRRADRGAGVTDAESVVLALAARREGREPGVLFDGVQLLAPACQDLVRIGLMPYIPNQPVVGGIEHIMQRNCKFYSAQSGGEMAAAGGNALDQKLAQFRAPDRVNFAAGRLTQIRRRGNGFEQRIAGGRDVHIAPVYTARPS